ncbi:MAG: hypothetical protein ACQEXJ_00060 [Myxococcota bacterium]
MERRRHPHRSARALVALSLTAGLLSCEAEGSGWPAPVETIPLVDGATVEGRLEEGATLPLDWADQSTVACWVGTENANFAGPHVLYAFERPMAADREMRITVTPEPGVDVSVWALQEHPGTFAVPPDIDSAVACEAAFDQEHDSNPGEAETTVPLTTGGAPLDVLLGVAGAEGHSSGAFTLTVEYLPD